jgi:hypothetical protein
MQTRSVWVDRRVDGVGRRSKHDHHVISGSAAAIDA